MPETIEVSRSQAEAAMPDWVRQNPVLRRAWHNSLSDRVEMSRADQATHDRAGAIRRVTLQIIRRYEGI